MLVFLIVSLCFGICVCVDAFVYLRAVPMCLCLCARASVYVSPWFVCVSVYVYPCVCVYAVVSQCLCLRGWLPAFASSALVPL